MRKPHGWTNLLERMPKPTNGFNFGRVDVNGSMVNGSMAYSKLLINGWYSLG